MYRSKYKCRILLGMAEVAMHVCAVIVFCEKRTGKHDISACGNGVSLSLSLFPSLSLSLSLYIYVYVFLSYVRVYIHIYIYIYIYSERERERETFFGQGSTFPRRALFP